ncbi:methyltransferase [Denitrificimonas sp. JX-1]|uniref:Methyltransferase n=1 Tax=Denitrificimonas halotolerans TaxID=3098930 RepID=A0ABU5GNZ8_9GAMM|nr:methyltransferase [Denitrificimonas sp. JX-1]MDY7218464.1 methyltransferase [Denitrificimonas sp. JX-1]
MHNFETAILSAEALRERFLALDTFLFSQRSIWCDKPFVQKHLSWEDKYPELAAWLRKRSLAEAEAFHGDPASMLAPNPFPLWAMQAVELSRIGCFQPVVLSERPRRMQSGIAERKWQQIEAFSSAIHSGARQSFSRCQRWLDWCAGKGHLGRYLAWPNTQLKSLEFDPKLVHSGQAMSQKYLPQAQHILCDVMTAASTQFLRDSDGVVALHACGDLHTHLVRQVSAHKVNALALVPCCYNRTVAQSYHPLSSMGRKSQLSLSRDDLGLPLMETVTATARERRLRDQSMAWRLAFDQVQREARGVDEYLPTPPLSSKWFNKSFAQWCQDLAALKGLSQLPKQNWQQLEALGWQRLAEVRNLELVRSLFRRPLELWLILDQALFLMEQGFYVELGEFCAQTLTPRNLLLLAKSIQ